MTTLKIRLDALESAIKKEHHSHDLAMQDPMSVAEWNDIASKQQADAIREWALLCQISSTNATSSPDRGIETLPARTTIRIGT